MTQPRSAGRLADALQTRNQPRTVDGWEEVLDRDDTEAVETDVGEMALVRERGQLQLHYAFDSLEAMKQVWHSMFEALRPRILASGIPYTSIDLVEHPNRRWIQELLVENDFELMGEWLEFEHNDVAEMEPPEIPEGYTMRRGTDADHDAVIALEGEAYGSFSDGATATATRLEQAGWLGVLERDGTIVAYAINTLVEGGHAEVLSCAVTPRAQGSGLGKVMLAAATYQIGSAGGRVAAVRVRPDMPKGARTAQAVGYSAGRRGIELRRDSDEALNAARREEQRIRATRVRFGSWR